MPVVQPALPINSALATRDQLPRTTHKIYVEVTSVHQSLCIFSVCTVISSHLSYSCNWSSHNWDNIYIMRYVLELHFHTCFYNLSVCTTSSPHQSGFWIWSLCTWNMSSLGLLWVKVQMIFRSRGRGRKGRGSPRLGITLGVRETDWVQRQRSSVDPLHRFRLDRGSRNRE